MVVKKSERDDEKTYFVPKKSITSEHFLQQ